MVQKFVEKRENLDWRRAAVFLGFGVFQVGAVQYGLYNYTYNLMLPGKDISEVGQHPCAILLFFVIFTMNWCTNCGQARRPLLRNRWLQSSKTFLG